MHSLLMACSVLLALISLRSADAQSSRLPFHGQTIFANGCNLAWFNFARDIGTGAVDTLAFAGVLDAVHRSGGNAMRLWLHVDGSATPEFDASGKVTGTGPGTLDDLHRVLDIAWDRRVGMILCLWSFDMLRESNNPSLRERNLALLTDTTATRAYIDRCLVPMVDSLRDHPAILGWEIFNEPEGMSTEFGYTGISRVTMAAVQRFINRCAGAIHRVSPSALVTSGAWSFKSLTDNTLAPGEVAEGISGDRSVAEAREVEKQWMGRYHLQAPDGEFARYLARVNAAPNFNYYTDARLVAEGGDPLGILDFYSVHYYDWAGSALSPLHHPVSAWSLDKPVVVAEFALKPTFGAATGLIYEALYLQGYAGALAWSWTDTSLSHRVDILASIQGIADRHRSDVEIGSGGSEPPAPSISSLLQNFPNPFNGMTIISLQLAVAERVRLTVYDLLGREVAILADADMPAGRYEFLFDGSGHAGGAYYCRLQAGDLALSRMMILIR